MKISSTEFETLFQEQEQYAIGTLQVLYPGAEDGAITTIGASIKTVFSAMLGVEKDLDFEDASQHLFMQLHSLHSKLGNGVVLSAVTQAVDDIINSIVMRMDALIKDGVTEAESAFSEN